MTDAHKEAVRKYDRSEKGRAQRRSWYLRNKEFVVGRSTEWAANHEDQVTLNKRASYLKLQYGLTLGQYEQMVESQSSRCAVCGISCNKLHIDHDHSTKRIRGLVCPKCNRHLAALDEPGWLEKGMNYIANRE